MRNFVLDRIFLRGQIERNEPFAGRLRLITITGDRLRGLDWQPGQHVRVHVGESEPGILPGPLRTYSVWDYRDNAIDLCVLDHGDGPGARWARTARPITSCAARHSSTTWKGMTIDRSMPKRSISRRRSSAE